MLTAERRQAILARLERDGRVVASELVAGLGVSEDTVRRDLRELADAGAAPARPRRRAPPRAADPSFARTGCEVSREAKVALAEAALPLLEGARVIVLDGGTTTLELARRLPPPTTAPSSPTRRRSRPRSPSHPRRRGHPHRRAAARRSRRSRSAPPPSRRCAPCARTSACSASARLHPDVGVTTLDHEEAHVKRAMVAGVRPR